MTKEIKGFITRDDFVNSSNSAVSPIYELSDIGSTYSKSKLQYYSSIDNLYNMYIFKLKELSGLSQTEVDDIVNVVKKFSAFLTSTLVSNKQQAIVLFINNYNSENPTKPVTNFNYNSIVTHNNIKTVDYITFSINGIICNFWLSDEVFKAFYPDYDINVVLPFVNFASIVNNTSDFITALDNFDPIGMNRRTEEDKNNLPSTYTKLINIPYRVPNTTVLKNCYFAFNIYGIQGNYDYILKLELYNKLVNELGLDSNYVESIFPTILNINEFFITPRWERMAIPSQIGQVGINSQIAKAFSEDFDLQKFIKIYPNQSYLRENTYSVPFDYNNLLLQITNGFYTISEIKDFAIYYKDFITVTSTHPDFSRMSTRTQRFVVLLENLLNVADSSNSTEMFNKILQNQNYHFTIISRAGVNYLSFFFEEHQYYVLPRYEFTGLMYGVIMPEITINAPSVGMQAYFTFKEPINYYVRNKFNLNSLSIKLKVISVISMRDMIRNDLRDPFTELYAPAGISEVEYKKDLLDNVSIISFSYRDRNNVEKYIRSPLNYIESVSNVSNKEYINKLVVLDLNRLPKDLDTSILFTDLADFVESRIGINPQIAEVSVGEVEMVDTVEHESRETIRTNMVSVYKTQQVRLEELQLQYDQVMNRLQELGISLG